MSDVYPTLIAITGTAGKTTTALFVYYLLKSYSVDAAYIGTSGIKYKNKSFKTRKTTPDNEELKLILRELKELHDIKIVVIEASSIGLALNRFDGIKIKYGAVTNFSLEHLDFHGTMEQYLEDKLLLLSKVERAVIHFDHSTLPFVAKAQELLLPHSTVGEISGGMSHPADTVYSYNSKTNAIAVNNHVAKINGRDTNIVQTKFRGRYNAANIMLAASILEMLEPQDLGLPRQALYLKNIVYTLYRANLVIPSVIENRMEPLGFNVFLDYAHKPIALKEALQTLRNEVDPGGEVHVVLGGCGGRTSIRQGLAEEAISGADKLYITDDRPLDEAPEAIRAELQGFAESFLELNSIDKDGALEIVPSRRQAIEKAINSLKPKDKLLIVSMKDERIILHKNNAGTITIETPGYAAP